MNPHLSPSPPAQEIERRFLVTQLPEGWPWDQREIFHIQQGYIAEQPCTVRLRRKRRFLRIPSEKEDNQPCCAENGSLESESWILCFKRGEGWIREEREIAITPEHFAYLWPLTEGWRLEKWRYRIPWQQHSIELDRFCGSFGIVYNSPENQPVHSPSKQNPTAHNSLHIAEVEFSSKQAAQTFVAPDWFGAEITGQIEYSNVRLAKAITRAECHYSSEPCLS